MVFEKTKYSTVELSGFPSEISHLRYTHYLSKKFIKLLKESYTYDHEKYIESKQFKSANGIYNSAAVACDSLAGSLVGK